MTIGDWIRARTPAAPVTLQQAVLAAVGPDSALDSARTTEVCLGTAQRLLTAILDAERFDRRGALDLLVVDALVTYAYEHASGTGADIEREAVEGLQRLGAIVAAHG